MTSAGAPLTVDVAVAGAGPAGWALAHALTRAGRSVAIIDPDPDARWPATYGAWEDEVSQGIAKECVQARMADARAWAGAWHQLGRTYLVLDNDALRTHLAAGAPPPQIVVGTVVRLTAGTPTRLHLQAGGQVEAAVVIDATGAARHLSGGRVTGARAFQTAVGIVVDEVPDHTLAFMDWRGDHGRPGWPTFLYAIPVGDGQTLLEETSLACRPELSLDELRARLHARMAARGIAVPTDREEELVRIVVDGPVTPGKGPVVVFGAGSPLIHPASGYSVAAALRLAAPVAATIDAALGTDPRRHGAQAAAAARGVVWSPTARATHQLRARGLQVLLSLPPDDVATFFATFFALPVKAQQQYLSVRDNPLAVGGAMLRMFATAPMALRRHMVTALLRRRPQASDA